MDKTPGIIKNVPRLNKKEILIPIVLFLFAFSIRFAYLNQIKNCPLFTPSEATVDEYLYDSWAKDIAFNDPIGKEAFWGLPLYPYFLGFIYFLFGPNVYIARLIQFLIGSINCALLYCIGQKIFNKQVGIISGVILSLYNTSIFYEGLLVSSTISIFLACVLILLVLDLEQNPNFKKSAILGLTLGLAGLAMPSIFLFMLFLFFWSLRHFRYLLFSMLLCFAIILSVTVRNYVLEKDFIPITAHSGINFYAGNNPAAKGTFGLPAYLGANTNTIRENSKTVAEKYLKIKLTPSQVSGFWFNEGLNFIKSEPLSYLSLLFKKFLLFWNQYEISDIFDMQFFRKFAGVLKLPLVNYAFISAFALLGLFLSFPQKNKNYILLQLFILSVLASLMIYFVNTRYRLPAIPALILFSSYGLYRLYKAVIAKQYTFLSCCLAGLVVFFFLGGIKLVRPAPENAHINLGVVYLDKKMTREAAAEFQKALELNPDHPFIHNNLGIAYKKLGRTDEAIKEYKIAIELAPGDSNTYHNLGLLYFEQGRYVEAIENFKKVLEINPGLEEARKKIALCYEAIGHAK